MFLGFFRLSILAFEVGERYVQRLVPEPDADCVYRHAFFMQCVGVGLAEAVKLGAFDAGFLRNRLQLAQEVTVRFALTIRKYQVMRLSVPFSHPVLDFPYQLRRNRNQSVLGGFLLALTFETKLTPRLRLNMQCAFFPVEVSVLGVLHLCITHPEFKQRP